MTEIDAVQKIVGMIMPYLKPDRFAKAAPAVDLIDQMAETLLIKIATEYPAVDVPDRFRPMSEEEAAIIHRARFGPWTYPQATAVDRQFDR